MGDALSNNSESEEAFNLQLLMNDYSLTAYGYISPILAVINVITNSLVCIVLLRQNMRSPTNTILLFMALSDMLTGVVPVPAFVHFYTLGHYEDWVPYNWCFAYNAITEHIPTMFHTASIWLTMALAFQRYVYVCHSLKAKQWCTIPNVLKSVLVIYIISVLCEVHRFFEHTYIKTTAKSMVDPARNIVSCVMNNSEWVTSHINLYYNSYYWFRVVFIHFIPCTSLVVFNLLLMVAMFNAQQRRKQLLKQNRRSECRKLKESNCTTLMLVAVVFIFLVVELPLGILFIIFIIQTSLGINIIDNNVQSVASLFINIAILFSYPINFFIYCAMSRQFRETFKRLFIPGAAPLDREHSQYISLATQNGTRTLQPTTPTVNNDHTTKTTNI
nr:MIP receptor 1 [Platynereis dumerilii]